MIDHHGAIWVAGDGRISVLQPDASRFELSDEPYNGTPEQLAESSDGTVWMAEADRAVRPIKPPSQGTHYQGLSKAECQRRFPNTGRPSPSVADQMILKCVSDLRRYCSTGMKFLDYNSRRRNQASALPPPDCRRRQSANSAVFLINLPIAMA